MKSMKKNEEKGCCSIAKALEILGGKYTLLIIRDLLHGPKRYGELLSSVGDISTKTLAERLVSLEHDGILTKKIFHEMPPHVEYALTEKGRALGPILDDLRKWGKGV